MFEGVAHEIEKLSKMKLESPVSVPSTQTATPACEQDNAAATIGTRTRSGPKTRASSELAEGASSTSKIF